MNIDTNTIATMTEANQNFSRVAKKADQYGEAIIFKNNRPKYRLVDLEQAGSSPDRELTDDEKIDIVARQILKEYKPACWIPPWRIFTRPLTGGSSILPSRRRGRAWDTP